MPSAPVRLAIAGCGRIACAVHLPALASMPDVRVVAIADADPDALAAAHDIVPGALALPDYLDLCRRDDVDAVVVCLPSHLHAEAALALLNAGKALYLEKPIALDAASARAVVEAGRAAARPAMMGFNYRFHPLIDELRQRVRKGDIGVPLSWRSTFTTLPQDAPAWKRSLATGGGVALDLLSHHVDLLRYVTGSEVRAVFATIYSGPQSEEQTATLQLMLDDCVVAQALASWSQGEADRIEVGGDAGTLWYDRHRRLGLEWRPANVPGSRRSLLAASLPVVGPRFAASRLRSPLREPSYQRSLAHFVDCLRTGTQPSPTLEDGLRSLDVILAARASARDRQLHTLGA